jgi:hypothetical protein
MGWASSQDSTELESKGEQKVCPQTEAERLWSSTNNGRHRVN